MSDDDSKKAFMQGIADVADAISAGHEDEQCPIGEAARMVANAAKAERDGLPMGEAPSVKVGYSRKYAANYDSIFGKKQEVGQA